MRCALVTGGTRGIGRAICDALIGDGFSVAIAYEKSDKIATEMIRDYQARGVNCIAIKADLSEKDGVNKIVSALDGFHRPDTLINNAGISHISELSRTSDIDAEKVMQVNFFAPLALIRELSKNMITRSFGRIVNITSMWAATGSSCESVYSASKAALEALSKSLAKELGGSNITVNCVAPGLIDTDMNKGLGDETIAEIVEATPLKRMGRPADIAEAVRFLIGENCFMTGATLDVSGGFAISGMR